MNCYRYAGSEMYIDVDGSSSYKDTWVTTKSVYLQVFRVRACKNVAVLLTEVVGAVQSHAYEITIGGHGHVTSIRDMSTGKGEQKVNVVLKMYTDYISETEK